MNGNYSERQLLLLSNFVYIPACVSDEPIRDILDKYRDQSGKFTESSVAAAAAGGGMSVSDVRTVFSCMDDEIDRDPSFGQLSASRKLEEKDVRAICYTDGKDNDPVVVFRGTGGTEGAWRDNFDGAYLEDTKIQKIADDFVKNECGMYESIIVTGHSKGGNLAQYVTVKENGKVSGCVSFDGQGFGDGFLKENHDEIQKASPKIRSVCAYNDFVNILLTSIAGTCVYVANESPAAAAHSPVTLLTSNTFDDDGNIQSVRKQGAVAAGLELFSDRMCDVLGYLSQNDRKAMSMMAGSAISRALTTPPDDFASGCVYPVLGMVNTQLLLKLSSEAKRLCDDLFPVRGSVYIEKTQAAGAIDDITGQQRVVENALAKVSQVRQTLAYTMSARICAEHDLEGVCNDLDRIRGNLERLRNGANCAIRSYEKTEQEVMALMNF